MSKYLVSVPSVYWDIRTVTANSEKEALEAALCGNIDDADMGMAIGDLHNVDKRKFKPEVLRKLGVEHE